MRVFLPPRKRFGGAYSSEHAEFHRGRAEDDGRAVRERRASVDGVPIQHRSVLAAQVFQRRPLLADGDPCMLSEDADIIDEHVCLLRSAEYVLAVRQRDVALAKNDVIPPLTPRASLPAIQFLYHDQIQREEFLNLGGGASFALSDKVDLFGSMIHTVAKERKKGRTTNRPASRIQNSKF